MHYHIILTERCNSKCKYCYEKSMNEFENGLEKRWHFDLDAPVDSKVSVEKLKKFLKKDDTLIFYGGEPLIKLEKIKEIIDNIDCKFYLQTNGKLLHLLPKEYLQKISKILVSIDGTKERTNKNKGLGTYEKVVENIERIRGEFKGEIVARMVISKSDVEVQVRHLINLGIFDSIHLQIDAGFYKNDFNFEEFSKFVEEYKKSLTRLIKFWVEEMKRGKIHKIYPFLGILNSLLDGEATKLRCGAGHANFTITTSGKLSACPIINSVKEFYCGNIEEGIKKNIEVIEPCTSCEYLNLCGGRCLYSNYAKLWPPEGEKLICETIIHLIEEIKKVRKNIEEFISQCKVQREDFYYEKYFGPEIIP